MLWISAPTDAVEQSFQAIEGESDHVVVPVAVNVDPQDGFQRVEIGSLRLGQGAVARYALGVAILTVAAIIAVTAVTSATSPTTTTFTAFAAVLTL